MEVWGTYERQRKRIPGRPARGDGDGPRSHPGNPRRASLIISIPPFHLPRNEPLGSPSPRRRALRGAPPPPSPLRSAGGGNRPAAVPRAHARAGGRERKRGQASVGDRDGRRDGRAPRRLEGSSAANGARPSRPFDSPKIRHVRATPLNFPQTIPPPPPSPPPPRLHFPFLERLNPNA